VLRTPNPWNVNVSVGDYEVSSILISHKGVINYYIINR
jgi:hypothetical protein